MKVNFKRMIAALAATAMCAVPMTSAISASAAEPMLFESSKVNKLDGAYIELTDAVRSECVRGVLSEAKQMATYEKAGNRLVAGGGTVAFDPEHGCGNGPRPLPVPDDEPEIIIVVVPGPRPYGPAGPCFRKEFSKYQLLK
ncbi:MAG: hypothetical protein IJJ81_01410 [Ruminococcus sp.]|nr:hypothetical protein [Ruminococcus sp.]